MGSQILIIEDDNDIRDSLCQLLEDEGYRVVSAANGQEGLESLRQLSEPCLILLDLFMPVMDGREFLERLSELRASGAAPAAYSKVLVLSAAPPQGEMAVAIRHRAEGFIRKPVDVDALLSELQRAAV